MPPRDNSPLALGGLAVPFAAGNMLAEGLASIGGVASILIAATAIIKALTEMIRVMPALIEALRGRGQGTSKQGDPQQVPPEGPDHRETRQV